MQQRNPTLELPFLGSEGAGVVPPQCPLSLVEEEDTKFLLLSSCSRHGGAQLRDTEAGVGAAGEAAGSQVGMCWGKTNKELAGLTVSSGPLIA